jgi:hypothetical protein
MHILAYIEDWRMQWNEEKSESRWWRGIRGNAPPTSREVKQVGGHG